MEKGPILMGGGWTGPLLAGGWSGVVGPGERAFVEQGVLFPLGGEFCLLPGSLAKVVVNTTAKYLLCFEALQGGGTSPVPK